MYFRICITIKELHEALGFVVKKYDLKIVLEKSVTDATGISFEVIDYDSFLTAYSSNGYSRIYLAKSTPKHPYDYRFLEKADTIELSGGREDEAVLEILSPRLTLKKTALQTPFNSLKRQLIRNASRGLCIIGTTPYPHFYYTSEAMRKQVFLNFERRIYQVKLKSE